MSIFSQEVKNTLSQARDVALSFNNSSLGSECFLVAMFNLNDRDLESLVTKNGLNKESIKKSLVNCLLEEKNDAPLELEKIPLTKELEIALNQSTLYIQKINIDQIYPIDIVYILFKTFYSKTKTILEENGVQDDFFLNHQLN